MPTESDGRDVGVLFARVMPGTVNDDKRTVDICWGTGAPVTRVDWYSGERYIEELSMDPEAVRMDFLASGKAPFTKDHQRGIDNVIGAIDAAGLSNGEGIATVRFDDDEESQRYFGKIKRGFLKNTSVYFRVHEWEVTQREDAADIYLATDWEPLAVGLVDIPADHTAEIRALDACFGRNKSLAAAAAQQEERTMTENNEPQSSGESDAAVADLEARLRQVEERNARLAIEARVREVAAEHGVHIERDAMDGIKSVEDGLAYILKERAKAVHEPSSSMHGAAIISDDAVDKVERAVGDALDYRWGHANDESLGLRGASLLQLGREWLIQRGMRAADIPYEAVQLAPMLFNARAAGGLSTADFTTYLLANAMDRAIHRGWSNAQATVWDTWCVRRPVKDFRTYNGAALDTGLFKETDSGVAFPSMLSAEKGYSDTLKTWGVNITMTLQHFINDDLGEWERTLQKVGPTAMESIEYQVHTVLAAATWTSGTNKTVTGPLGTDGNLAKGVAGMMNRAGSADTTRKIGLRPRYLLVPAGLYEAAGQRTTEVQGATAKNVNTFLTPLVTPYLATAATASESTYYLVADPAIADTVVVGELQGQSAPGFTEFDSGAQLSRKWIAWKAFEATHPSLCPGVHQCTNA